MRAISFFPVDVINTVNLMGFNGIIPLKPESLINSSPTSFHGETKSALKFTITL